MLDGHVHFVDKTFDPSTWTPYDCVCQVLTSIQPNRLSSENVKKIWQDYATIKDEVDQKAALRLVLSDPKYRVAKIEAGVIKYYTASPF